MLGRTNQVPPLRPGVRTNLTAAATPATAQVPPPHATARTPAGTNRAPAVARAGAGKNASLAKGAKTGIGETIRNLQTNNAFYPAIGVM